MAETIRGNTVYMLRYTVRIHFHTYFCFPHEIPTQHQLAQKVAVSALGFRKKKHLEDVDAGKDIDTKYYVHTYKQQGDQKSFLLKEDACLVKDFSIEGVFFSWLLLWFEKDV